VLHVLAHDRAERVEALSHVDDLGEREDRHASPESDHPSRLDIANNTLTPIGTTRLPRTDGALQRLPNDRVLLIGGGLFHDIANEPEIWNPKTTKGEALPGFEKALDKQIKDLAKHREREKKKRS
jgi:hypothetical protein